jgi:hypothetical protein
MRTDKPVHDLGSQEDPSAHERPAVQVATACEGAVIRFDQLGELIPAISARVLQASTERLDEIIMQSLQEV